MDSSDKDDSSDYSVFKTKFSTLELPTDKKRVLTMLSNEVIKWLINERKTSFLLNEENEIIMEMGVSLG